MRGRHMARHEEATHVVTFQLPTRCTLITYLQLRDQIEINRCTNAIFFTLDP